MIGHGDAVPDPPTTADLILREAAVLFQHRGYAAATTRELGEAVGIRGPSVYHHYKMKEDILYAICLESLRRLTDRVSAVAETDDALLELRALIETHVVNILEDRHMHATMLTEMRYLSVDRRHDVTRKRDEYEGIMCDRITSAQHEGTVRADIPARQLTLALLSLLNWTIFWFSAEGELDVAAVAGLLSRVFLEGAIVRA